MGSSSTDSPPCPDDSLAPEYLYSAAELANGLLQRTRAIELFAKNNQQYPLSKKAPVCLFFQGFIYETQLNDLPKAKELYSEFLQKFPDHQLTKDVKFSLDNLGKSPEELIKQFEQNTAVQAK